MRSGHSPSWSAEKACPAHPRAGSERYGAGWRREFREAVREVLAANAQVFSAGTQGRERAKKNNEEMRSPTPRHLRHFVTRRLRLRRYLRNPGDGRRKPQILAELLLWLLLLGQILHEYFAQPA